jgi:hypothetical protein
MRNMMALTMHYIGAVPLCCLNYCTSGGEEGRPAGMYSIGTSFTLPFCLYKNFSNVHINIIHDAFLIRTAATSSLYHLCEKKESK